MCNEHFNSNQRSSANIKITTTFPKGALTMIYSLHNPNQNTALERLRFC